MKKRKDCFFGLHFDFHAGENDTGIGETFDDDALVEIIEKVRPDYLQCDTKGHPGYSSYPTAVGNRAPGMKGDILKKWREITAAYDIPLYAHHSGITDELAGRQHPDWCCVQADGTVKPGIMSPFGAYADSLLIPQLKELAAYGLNGAWVDGECWAAVPDYGDKAAAAYKAETGREPERPGNPDIDDYFAFNREAFKRYVAHYIAEVKKQYPDFEITSNWMNTSQVPDDIDVTDFISGDLAEKNCVDSARLETRIIANFDKNWDIMSWGFRIPGRYLKTAVQLEQEAALVISQGGGFQIFNHESPRHVLHERWAVDIWAEVAAFCRARAPFCRGGRPVHEVAVIHSLKAFYKYKDCLFGFWGNEYTFGLHGVLNALLENGFSAEVLLSFRALKTDLDAFSALFVTEADDFEPELMDALIGYARRGGKLIVTGAKSARRFAEAAGLTVGETAVDPAFLPAGTDTIKMEQPYAPLTGAPALDSLVLLDERLEPKGEVPVSARVPVGSGSITVVAFDFGLAYLREKTAALRNYLGRLTADVPKKAAVSGSRYVDVHITEKDGKTYVHLINTGGEHRAEGVRNFDELPPLYNLSVRLALGRKPDKVTMQPENAELPVTYAADAAVVTVPRLDVYSILVIE